MDDVVVQTRGLAALEVAMRGLPDKVQKRALKKAFAAGARVVAREIQSRAPVDTGALKRNVVAKQGDRRYQGGAAARYIVGVRHGKPKPNAPSAPGKRSRATAYDRRGEDPFYFRFQELGYTAVGRRVRANRAERAERAAGGGSYGRKIPGKRFMRDGFEASAARATETIRAKLEQEIAKL